MPNIDFRLIAGVMLFVILISIQITLNRILMTLREIKRDIRSNQFNNINNSSPRGPYFFEKESENKK